MYTERIKLEAVALNQNCLHREKMQTCKIVWPA